jgi:hypothetical protein
VLALAGPELLRFGDRVRLVEGDARRAALGSGFGTALLANLVHLHPPQSCVELCAVAAAAVEPGGQVVIKDLLLEGDHSGPLSGLLFALNMAIYTEAGDVYDVAELCRFLAQVGLVSISVQRLLAAPDAVVVSGRKPHRAPAAAAT